ncbi:DUF2510 domain-containing protein [Rhodococcus qingshengii]|uniref:DUF2510 domain-containing protein n=1 Tax=Rhodococcus qingshengii TaxID=334542 RepID=UPI001C8BADA6|nr:DUF2510 domain-containing protein [Rhodococcus qingshengii]MBX9151978.1 DUF2510 domain-containing protein [Rhodococcus qingshengii]
MTRPPSPGWYPDPENPALNQRWWDGTQWTPTVQPINSQSHQGDSVVRGANIKDSLFSKWFQRWEPEISSGENIKVITRVSGLKPALDSMVITDRRVMAGWSDDVIKSGPKVALEINRLSRVEIRKQMSGHFLYIISNVNATLCFGRLEAGDVESNLIADTIAELAPWSRPAQPAPINHNPAASAPQSPLGEPEPMEGFVPYATAPPQHQQPIEFDASTPPHPGTQVPSDCVWAQIPHPGPIPKGSRFGDTASRMRALGTIAGRTEREITAFVGAPNARNGTGDGNYILQWIKIGAWSGSSHYVLSFDRYGVCWGIDHEFA